MTFTSREFSEFNGLLAAGVERGLSLEPALELHIGQARSRRVRDLLRRVLAALREGRPLEKALDAAGGELPEGYAAWVAAGVASGRLSDVLRRVEERERLVAGVKERFIRLAAYLAAGLGLAFLALGVTAWLAVEVRNANPAIETWTRAPLLFQLTFRYPFLFFPGIALILAGAAWGFVAGLRWASARGFGYRIPVFGPLFKSRDLALLCDVAAMRMRSGVPLPEALEAAAGAVSNRCARRELEAVRQEAGEGKPLSEAMERRRWFPRTLAWALSVGEARGEAPDILDAFAGIYGAELDRRFEVLWLLTTPLGILAVGNFAFFPIFAIGVAFMEMIGRWRF